MAVGVMRTTFTALQGLVEAVEVLLERLGLLGTVTELLQLRVHQIQAVVEATVEMAAQA